VPGVSGRCSIRTGDEDRVSGHRSTHGGATGNDCATGCVGRQIAGIRSIRPGNQHRISSHGRSGGRRALSHD